VQIGHIATEDLKDRKLIPQDAANKRPLQNLQFLRTKCIFEGDTFSAYEGHT